MGKNETALSPGILGHQSWVQMEQPWVLGYWDTNMYKKNRIDFWDTGIPIKGTNGTALSPGILGCQSWVQMEKS